MAKKKKQKMTEALRQSIELFDYMDQIDEKFDKQATKLMEDDKAIMNSNDYCYACVAICPAGHKNIFGFARTFEGVKEVKTTFLEADKVDNKTLEGVKFMPPERWSRNNFISFFEAMQKHKKEWVFLLNGFVSPEVRMYIETPADIPNLLKMNELYNE